MLVKVAALAGQALDWAVAKCKGWITYPTDSVEQGDWYHTDAASAPLGYAHNRVYRKDFSPSSNWAQGGPLIDLAGIAVSFGPQWTAVHNQRLGTVTGHTPLIAICRCYVASQLGDEVEVPDEIFKG
jgi:hypothetical protein